MNNNYTVEIAGIISITIIKIICFTLGFLTIWLGYKLTNDGVKGQFKFSGDYKGIKGGLVSSSPGLLFLMLGIILIGYAMGVTKTVDRLEQDTPDGRIVHTRVEHDSIKPKNVQTKISLNEP